MIPTFVIEAWDSAPEPGASYEAFPERLPVFCNGEFVTIAEFDESTAVYRFKTMMAIPNPVPGFKFKSAYTSATSETKRYMAILIEI